ncbi:MAG: magnesium transporter, partial [Baekduia sp.]|nr:magnesium transporter [Baekduia sp.]
MRMRGADVQMPCRSPPTRIVTVRCAQVIVDRAIYRDGQRVAEPSGLPEMAEACRDGGGMAWIGLYRPTA